MRALAEVLVGWGWQVSGSDPNVADVQSLAGLGVRLFKDQATHPLSPDIKLVIRSDAVPMENPELRRATELGIPTISYFEMLGRIGANRDTIAIAGTHGKSTTTAMAAHILVEAGQDPTVFCGATPFGKISGGRAGHGALMLVEACEYHANFLNLQPRDAAILGIEPDHFDYYDSLNQIEDAFRHFAALLPADGLLLARHDCASTRRMTASLPCRVESFGTCPEADWAAQELEAHAGCFRFEIQHHGQPIGAVQLQMPGRHNVLNALAAAALAWTRGVPGEQIAAGISSFAGLHRRLELLETWRGVAMVDDYAHHPTEVAAALEAVRAMFPHRRLWCVFQPHQASRTARLLHEFASSLQNADIVMVAEICRARENDCPLGGVTAADLARETARLGVEVLSGHGAEKIRATLQTRLAPGDVLVTLGAGDGRPLRPPPEPQAVGTAIGSMSCASR
jgi:UDP-N-acetylmuramate--alanine ligase